MDHLLEVIDFKSQILAAKEHKASNQAALNESIVHVVNKMFFDESSPLSRLGIAARVMNDQQMSRTNLHTKEIVKVYSDVVVDLLTKLEFLNRCLSLKLP